MARVWSVEQSDCTKVNLLNDSDDKNAIWLENTWHEVSPTHAATLPEHTYVVDNNNKLLTLVDGYCTTYFYKGWQTVSSLTGNAVGSIIESGNSWPALTNKFGIQVANENRGWDGDRNTVYLQVVRVRDGIIALPHNMGKNLIPDLYPGALWGGGNRNWLNQWSMTPLVPYDGYMSPQNDSFPRTFTIDETFIPAYVEGHNNYPPEMFAPYMYLLRLRFRPNGTYLGGIIVVIGVKKLS